MELFDTQYCHSKELEGVQGFDEELLVEAIEHSNDTTFHFAYIWFSGAARKGYAKYAEELKTYIIYNDLGSVTQTAPHKNPNTTNVVTLYIWEIDRKACQKWYKIMEKKYNKS